MNLPLPHRRVLAGAVVLTVAAAGVVLGRYSVADPPPVPPAVTLVAAPVAGDRGAPAIQTAVECQRTGPILVVTVSPHTSPAVGTVYVGEQLVPADQGFPHHLGDISIAGPSRSPAESRFALSRLDGQAYVGADAWVLPTPTYVDYFCAGANR